MSPLMQKFPLNCPEILRPQLFDMDQRPLAAAKLKMLQSGNLKELLLFIFHR